MSLMKKSPEFILITGDGEGFGNAILHRCLIRCPDAQIIGISRRPIEKVNGFNLLDDKKKSRYHHFSINFTNADAIARIIENVSHLIMSKKGVLISAFLVTGTGFTDNDIRTNPSLEKILITLNEEIPIKLSEQLMLNPALHFAHNTIVFYFSGLVAHPNISDPSLQTHAHSKRKTTARLKELLQHRVVFVAPGAYRTEMLLNTIQRPDALLEWFASPLADPFIKGGLPDLLAKYALLPRKKIPDFIIRLRLAKLLVTTFSQKRLLETMPGAIKIFGRSVLEATKQTDAQYNEKIDYHKQRNSYGANFPYTSLYAKNLYPLFLSKLISRILNFLGMTR